MASHLKPSRPIEANNAPKSTAPSSVHDVISSQRLVSFLDKVAPLETEADRGHKEVVLQELHNIIHHWICEVAVEKGLYSDVESAQEVGGSLFVSGSYKLSINTADSDVDTIFVGPRFVSRSDFFEKLAPRLQTHPGVTSMLPISDASVPIIELELHGVSIDLQFVPLPVNIVPKALNILDDNVLQGLDPSAARSLNGPRVNELISRLVPNFETFKPMTRVLRLWAKARGLYNNKMGFLGGINFAILSAFICQLYPSASPATLVAAFFREFKDWRWPDPVFLTKPYVTPLSESGLLRAEG